MGGARSAEEMAEFRPKRGPMGFTLPQAQRRLADHDLDQPLVSFRGAERRKQLGGQRRGHVVLGQSLHLCRGRLRRVARPAVSDASRYGSPKSRVVLFVAGTGAVVVYRSRLRFSREDPRGESG